MHEGCTHKHEWGWRKAVLLETGMTLCLQTRTELKRNLELLRLTYPQPLLLAWRRFCWVWWLGAEPQKQTEKLQEESSPFFSLTPLPLVFVTRPQVTKPQQNPATQATNSHKTSSSFPLFSLSVSASWQEVASMIFLFSKIANFVLFARSDLRLGLIYLILCLGELI